jgi:anti-sigma-K factor RskA
VVEEITSRRAIPEPRRPHREGRLALLSAAAVVIAFALGAYAVSLQRRIAVLEEQVRSAADRAAQGQQQLVQLRAAADQSTQVRRILAAGDLRRLDLAGTKAAPATAGRAFWSPAEGLVVAFANLPPTEAGRVYQLWVIPPGGSPIDAGLLELQPDGRALALAKAGTAQRVGTVAITLEPAGGSPVPTLGNMIAAGTLTN